MGKGKTRKTRLAFAIDKFGSAEFGLNFVQELRSFRPVYYPENPVGFVNTRSSA